MSSARIRTSLSGPHTSEPARRGRQWFSAAPAPACPGRRHTSERPGAATDGFSAASHRRAPGWHSGAAAGGSVRRLGGWSAP
ncbi:hypothetical protein AB0J55_21435 [Amycolatopsis sp. NPDC049688]|uniref:hypothetical protein n=1 Tax=Amycolatopsis sp. NPDC049688 TaxID=3154733 RepID=UPI003447D51B